MVKKYLQTGVLLVSLMFLAGCGAVNQVSSENSEHEDTEAESTESENQMNSEVSEQETIGVEDSENADNEGISMKFMELQEEESGLTAIFSIENLSDNVIYYDAEFTLEKRGDDIWEECDLVENADWNAVLYELQSGDTIDITVYIESYYGELSDGSYRITKKMYSSEDLDNATDVSCIFDIS